VLPVSEPTTRYMRKIHNMWQPCPVKPGADLGPTCRVAFRTAVYGA